MMSGTHMLVGVSASLAILQPTTITECICVAAGGAIGGFIPDLDMRSSEGVEEAFTSKLKVLSGLAAVLAIAIALDYSLHTEIVSTLMASWAGVGLATAIGVLALLLFGMTTSHRTFMHSILGFLGFSVLTHFALEPFPHLATAFAIGYALHILLDLTNKRGLQLFWPVRRSFCFGWCDANGKANGVISVLTLIATIVLMAWFAIPAVRIPWRMLFNNSNIFLIYIFAINILAYIVHTVNWHFGERLPLNDQLRGAGIDTFAILGGGLGQLIALIQQSRPGKDNAGRYVLTIATLFPWVVVSLIVFGVLRIGNSPITPNSVVNMRYVFYYLAAINIATFVVYMLDKKKHTKLDAGEIGCLLLALVGGSAGGLLAMSLTGRKRGSEHFRKGLPAMLIAQTIIVVLLLMAQ